MFSSSTIESSTSRPIPSARPPKVNTFSVCPEKYSTINVTMIESGMATEMISVLVRLRRKIKMTAAARSDPCKRLLDEVADRLADIDRLVERNAEFHARAECRSSSAAPRAAHPPLPRCWRWAVC